MDAKDIIVGVVSVESMGRVDRRVRVAVGPPLSAHTVENPMLFMYHLPKFDEPLAAGDHWNPCL